ncbi:MAG: dihydropyrimidinase, partial [Betaproteobacteria bacterium]|nr:dihydropyrimidinase [Betaproteobacteria bacterium]
MTPFDLTIRNGTVVNADGRMRADVGVRDGLIHTLAPGLPAGARDINASGQLVLPGGIDSHCHVEQISSNGVMTADDFDSATVA